MVTYVHRKYNARARAHNALKRPAAPWSGRLSTVAAARPLAASHCALGGAPARRVVTGVALIVGCAPVLPPPPLAPLTSIERIAVGCWTIVSPRLQTGQWRVRLDSTGQQSSDTAVAIRQGTTAQGPSRFVAWSLPRHVSDSIEIGIGAAPPGGLLFRVAVYPDSMAGSAWRTVDLAPFHDPIGAAKLMRDRCTT